MLFKLSTELDLCAEFLRKKTFSAVGFGQDKIPFLSTQQRACHEKNIFKKLKATFIISYIFIIYCDRS